jgi:redox-sensitive bicupin YhaK (pirin superfamily)
MIELVISARRRDLGGLEVGRILPATPRRMVGPFIFLDHLGPISLPSPVPRATDVRPHPHIGLATVTYLFTGEIIHRDSLGCRQPIQPGAVNWMTAGRGITHSERFERARREGGSLHGIQAWVALPESDEETTPSFAHLEASALPGHEGEGLAQRLIAGEAFGARSPAQIHSPLFYVDCALQAGARAPLPGGYRERAAYVAVGSVELAGRSYARGQLLIFTPGTDVALRAREPSRVLLLGGEPLGERFIEWNFVSSSRERIEQAKADWRAGRMKLPELDDREFIPLPPAAPQGGGR